MDARKELVAFYTVHNPSKLKDVDRLLETFQGREAAMMAALREKYGDPSPRLCAANEAHTSRAEQEDKGQRVRRDKLRKLLAEMGTIDLAELASHLADADTNEAEWVLLLTHTTAYVEHLAQCAKDFLELARSSSEGHPTSEVGYGASRAGTMLPEGPPLPSSLPRPSPPSSPLKAMPPEQLARALRTGRGMSASWSPSPPSVARTDTQSASPLVLPAEQQQTAAVGPSIAPATPLQRGQEWARENTPSPPLSPPPLPLAPIASSTAVAAGKVRSLAAVPLGRSALPATVESGDCLELQPGVYYESIVLENCGAVEITAAYPGAAVVLRPASKQMPVLVVRGPNARVTVRGVVFVVGDVAKEAVHGAVPSSGRGEEHHQQQRLSQRCPLVAVEEGAELLMEGCHLYNGGAGGLTAAGAGTVAQLRLCLVSLCAFAGVYAHAGAVVEVSQCRMKNCECGLRVCDSASTLRVAETTVETNSTDGVVVHGPGSACVLTRCAVSNNGGSGLYVGKGSEARLVETSVELNGVYGVHRSRGSRLHLQQSFIRDNALMPISEERA